MLRAQKNELCERENLRRINRGFVIGAFRRLQLNRWRKGSIPNHGLHFPAPFPPPAVKALTLDGMNLD